MVLEALTYGFVQKALISGIAVAIICSFMGTFLVLRRYSLFGDGIAHVAFGGIAVGLFFGHISTMECICCFYSWSIRITKTKTEHQDIWRCSCCSGIGFRIGYRCYFGEFFWRFFSGSV